MSQSGSAGTSRSPIQPTPQPAPGRPVQAAPPGLPPVLMILAYILIGSLPLLLAEEQIGSFWHKLSSGLAMVCFALLSVQFVVSSRLPALTGKLSIGTVMRFHQRAAQIITIVLLIHPFLYLVPVAIEDPAGAPAQLLTMFSSGAMASGVLAWVMLLGLTASAMLRHWLPVPYEAWRLTHGLGAVALAIAGLHHAINIGSYSDDLTLAQLWIVLVGAVFCTVGYLYLVKPWQLSQRPYYVSHVHRVGENQWGITLWPAKLQPVGVFARGMKAKITPALPFEAGQFAWVTIGASPFVFTDHPLAIASAPADRPRFRFIVEETGDFSKAVGRFPIGTRAYIDGPYGRFTLSVAQAALPKGAEVKGLAFIAEGIGIAPILSLLRDRKAAGETRPLRLIYGSRAAPRIVAREELAALEEEADFRVRHVLQDPPYDWLDGTGALDAAAIEAWVDWPDPAGWLYFLCGSDSVMAEAEQALLARGVPAARIRSERLHYD